MRKLTKASELANFLLRLQDDEGELLEKLPESAGDVIRESYSGQFARFISGAGYTIDSFISELESICSPRWLMHSRLIGIIEMADPRSPYSPLHEHTSSCGCGTSSKPFDPDDPWGELARIEAMADT